MKRDGKRRKAHLWWSLTPRREVSDLLALELQVAAEVGAGRNVEDSAGEGLITETSSAIVLINVEKKRRQDEPRQEERTQSRSA
jgi:hypothetical protein